MDIVTYINSHFKHLYLYQFAVDYRMFTKIYLFTVFAALVGCGIYANRYDSELMDHGVMLFSCMFTVPILLVTIDRAYQLIQFRSIMREYGILDAGAMNVEIQESNYKWSII